MAGRPPPADRARTERAVRPQPVDRSARAADLKGKRPDHADGGQRHLRQRRSRAGAGRASRSGASPLATSPAELMSARLVLEPAIIAMVIGNATAADFDRMDDCCDKGEARGARIEEFELWDGKLHEAIADAAHNAFISTVFQRMNEVRAQSEWGMLKRRSATPERRAGLPARAPRTRRGAEGPRRRARQRTLPRPPDRTCGATCSGTEPVAARCGKPGPRIDPGQRRPLYWFRLA